MKSGVGSWMKEPLGALIARKSRAWWSAPAAHPWSEELNDAVDAPDSLRVCHRCFTEQDHSGWFCQECGAATGPYNNVMPFIYIFSVGEVFRAGVQPARARPVFVTVCYLILSVVEDLIFFPFYWYRILTRRGTANSEEPTPVGF